MSRFLGIVSVALITAGLILLVDIGVTLGWGEPISTVHGWLAQRKAADDLTELEQELPTRRVSVDGRVDRSRVRAAADELAARVEPGDAIGRMRVRAIDLSIVLVEGTDTASLQKGPGHYPGTAFPGQPGTAAVAGHRTTYLAPFRHIDRLGRGDDVIVEMPYATFTYRFQKQQIVDPSDTKVVRDVAQDRLVMTACHPVYSAAQRIVVTSRLVDVDPPGGDDERGAAAASAPEPAIGGPSVGPALAGLAGVALVGSLMWVWTGRRPRLS